MTGHRRRTDPAPAHRVGAGRLRALATVTVVLGALTVLGVAGAGGTYALLSARTETAPVTLTAGTMHLQVQGAVTADLGTWTLTPATPQARAFTVGLSGDVPGSLSARLAATTTPAILANTQARLTPVGSAAACTVGLGGPLADLNGYTRVGFDTLVAGQVKTYCLELRLKAGTPVAQSGQGVSFTVTLDATQVP